jgi:hypothetical protein
MADVYRPGWEVIEQRCSDIADAYAAAVKVNAVRDVFGVPRGGCVPAAMIATRLGLPLVEAPGPHSLLVDDLIDSGTTAMRYAGLGAYFVALFRKPWSPEPIGHPPITVDAWIELPWEVNEAPGLDAVLRLLQLGGLDTTLPHVLDAARRSVQPVSDAAVSLVAATAEEGRYSPAGR